MPNKEYSVKSGDTLSAIARRHNVAMDVLARLNGISDVNRLYVGQVLKLPEPVTSEEPATTEPQSYRVRAGETLGELAPRFGVSVDELCKANGITELTALVVGQVLIIPKKSSETEKKPSRDQKGTSTSTPGTKPSTNELMEVAFRITGAFEGGQAKSYQNEDSGIVSYGKHQATLASGTLGTILQKYVDQSASVTAKQLSAYMDKVNKKDASLRDDAGFKKLLLAAADDSLMGTIQDAVFAENYWPTAEKGAKEDKLQTPLALAMYYDTNIQGGLSAVRKLTAEAMKGKEFSEAAWLKEFNQQRDQRLKDLAAGRRKTAKDKKTTAEKKKALERDAAWIEGSRVRVTDLQKLVEAGDFQLQGDKEGKLLVNGKRVDGLKGGGGKSGGNPTKPLGSPSVVQVAKPPVTNKPSANYGSRGSTDIDAIIVHHTASNNAAQDLVQLTQKGTGVSSHYLIAPDGTIYQLVDDDKRAWHAGVSAIRGEATPDVNSRSIGIEITNDGRGQTPFTEEQYKALEQLVPYLAVTYAVPMENILGHRDVAPGRKTDPADNFDWSRVRNAVKAARGDGGGGEPSPTTDSKPTQWVAAPSMEDVTNKGALLKQGMKGPSVELLQKELVRTGYLTNEQMKTGPGLFGAATRGAVDSFQQKSRISVAGGSLGQVDKLTWESLRKASPVKVSPVSPQVPKTPPGTSGGGGKVAQAVDLKEVARNVHDAMSGLGTDEEKLYANLAKLNHDEKLINQFKALYKTTYRVDVVEDLKADLSNNWWAGPELDRALGYLTPSGKAGSSGSEGGSQKVLGNGVSIDTQNATLTKLATGTLTSGGDGMCVTVVRNNMTALGVSTYSTTGNDPNNSRGAMVQLLLSGKWESVPLPGAVWRTLESKTAKGAKAYGNADAYVCAGRDVLKAANADLIPAGTLIFQTMYGWDYSGGASGNDVGIVRKEKGAVTTFNYKQMSGILVHESAKKKHKITKDDEVVLLVPKGALVRK